MISPSVFNPRISAERQALSPLRRAGREFFEAPATYFTGQWEQRHLLNVPGPFFGALTDTCCDGPYLARRSLLVDEEGSGFVWRQPRNDAETLQLMTGCSSDPFAGFAWDGDQHWTPDLVREWWTRSCVRDEQVAAAGRCAADLRGIPGDLQSDYLSYTKGDDIEHDLRRYLFFLTEGHYPNDDEDLPNLGS